MGEKTLTINWAGEWKGEFSAVRDMDDTPVE